MKYVGILSDTHGYLDRIDALLEETMDEDISLWLHAGDYGDDARYMATQTSVPVLAVRGNNDRVAPLEPREQIIPFDNTHIYMEHGDRYAAYDRAREVLFMARHVDAKLAVVGHSHRHGSVYEGDCLFVNPGSLALPRDGSQGTYAIASYDGEIFQVTFHELSR